MPPKEPYLDKSIDDTLLAALQEAVDGKRWFAIADDTRGLVDLDGNLTAQAELAVLIRPGRMDAVFDKFFGLRQELLQEIGVDKFHFSDLHAQGGDFVSLEADRRMYYIRSFVDLFVDHQLPILWAVYGASNAQFAKVLGMTAPPFSNLLSDPESACLFILAFACPRFRDDDLPMTMIADTHFGVHNEYWGGWDADGNALIQGLDPPYIMFTDSGQMPIVQIADFAAWAFGRIQRLRAKGPLLAGTWSASVYEELLRLSALLHFAAPPDLDLL